MPRTIPAAILLAKERASSFRRCVEILHDDWKEGPYPARNQVWFFLAETVKNQWDARTTSPLVTFEWALEWANSSPPPPAASLREARTLLEATASNWAQSSDLLLELLNHTRRFWGRPCPDWPCPDWICQLADLAKVVASEKRRLDLALRESWPVADEKEEQQTVEEMRKGAGVEVDDAFARIANVPKDEWLRRIERRKQEKAQQTDRE